MPCACLLMICYKYIRSVGMNLSMHISGYTYATSMSNIPMPPVSTNINHGRFAYLTWSSGNIWPLVLSHAHASRWWAASHDAKVQAAGGIAVANKEVQPPRYVGQKYESARCMRMRMVLCHQRLGLADMASDRSSIPPGAVGSTDRRQHDRNGTRCVAHDDAGRMQRNKACG